uniref:Uncharacterized protein n=1 Tax=Lepeophtheirus salmonis TaxID=72036 RepID=A0A0K2VGL1_LEPSM
MSDPPRYSLSSAFVIFYHWKKDQLNDMTVNLIELLNYSGCLN